MNISTTNSTNMNFTENTYKPGKYRLFYWLLAKMKFIKFGSIEQVLRFYYSDLYAVPKEYSYDMPQVIYKELFNEWFNLIFHNFDQKYIADKVLQLEVRANGYLDKDFEKYGKDMNTWKKIFAILSYFTNESIKSSDGEILIDIFNSEDQTADDYIVEMMNKFVNSEFYEESYRPVGLFGSEMKPGSYTLFDDNFTSDDTVVKDLLLGYINICGAGMYAHGELETLLGYDCVYPLYKNYKEDSGFELEFPEGESLVKLYCKDPESERGYEIKVCRLFFWYSKEGNLTRSRGLVTLHTDKDSIEYARSCMNQKAPRI